MIVYQLVTDSHMASMYGGGQKGVSQIIFLRNYFSEYLINNSDIVFSIHWLLNLFHIATIVLQNFLSPTLSITQQLFQVATWPVLRCP